MRLLTVLLTFAAASLPTMTSLGQEPQPPAPAAPVASAPQGVAATTVPSPSGRSAWAPAGYALPTRFTPESTERFSTPLMGIGIGVTVLGIIGAALGTALVGYGGTACPNQDSECLVDQRLGYSLGAIWLSAGNAVAGAGLALWIVGNRGEPARARALPSVRLGPTSAKLEWAF